MKKISIGNATLYHGNCEEALKDLKNECVDAVITDPPYLYLKKQKLDMAFDEETVFTQWHRVLKNNSLIAFFGRGDSFFRWNLHLNKLGFSFKETAVWEKENASNFLGNFLRIHEDIAFREKGKRKINKCHIDYLEYQIARDTLQNIIDTWKKLKDALKESNKEEVEKYITIGLKNFVYTSKRRHEITAGKIKQPPRIVNTLQTVKNGKIETSIMRCKREAHHYEHPTQKPIELMSRIINLTTKENDVVLDSFMGGGSTGVASISTNRCFIGIERDEEYFDIAVKRITEAYKNKEMCYDRKVA